MFTISSFQFFFYFSAFLFYFYIISTATVKAGDSYQT